MTTGRWPDLPKKAMPTAYQATARGLVDVERKNARKAFDNSRSVVIRRCNLSRFISDCQLPINKRVSNYKFNRQSEIDIRQFFLWVVAQLAELRTVTAAREGSTPFDPPKSLPISDCRLSIHRGGKNIWGCSLVGIKRCTVDAEIASSSLVSPANNQSAIGNHKSQMFFRQ